MTTMRLKLEGPGKSIAADALSTAVRSWLNVIENVDAAVSGQGKITLKWYIDDLSTGSVNVALRAESLLENHNFGNEVVHEAIRGMHMLETKGLTPPYLTYTGIKAAKGLVKLIGRKGVSGISLSGEGEETELSKAAANSIDQLTKVRRRSIGSVEGKLEMISVHRRHEATVYHAHTHKAVRCRFPETMLEDVKAALGQRVIAAGEVQWNAKNEPVTIMVSSIRPLRPQIKLPSIEDLSGAWSDAFGDMDSVSYVRSMRDE